MTKDVKFYKSIRFTTLLIFVLLVVFSLVFYASFAIWMTYGSDKQNVFNHLETIADLKERQILNWPEILLKEVKYPVFMNSERFTRDSVNAPTPFVENLLERNIKHSEYLKDYFVLNTSGYITYSTRKEEISAYRGLYPYFKMGLSGDYIHIQTHTYASSVENINSILVSSPIRDFDGNVIGVMCGIANLDFLNSLMQDSPGMGKTGQAYLVGENQVLLTEASYPNFKPGQTFVSTTGVLRVLSDQDQKKIKLRTYSFGQKIVGVYKWIEPLSVVLVAEQTCDEAFSTSETTLFLLILVVILCIGVSVAIGYFWSTSYILKPISKLSKHADELTYGRYDVDIEMAGDNEIARLGQAFQIMTVRLRESIAKLQQRILELKETQEMLHKSERLEAIGRLAGGIAHDFNNMLTGIVGANDMLKQSLENRPALLGFCNIIAESASRAGNMTQNLLTFARRKPGVFTIIEAHEAIRRSLEFLKSILSNNVSVELALNATETGVFADYSKLESALINLGINASHAMPNVGTISVRTRNIDVEEDFCKSSSFDLRPGVYIEIEFCDTGIGIPPEHIDRIFDPFFTTKKQGEGTGLGLSAVLGTIQEHKGSITVSSEIEKGTRFTMLLPVSTRNIEASIAAVPEKAIEGEGRILFVDDEPYVRVSTEAILRNLGYDVLLAENGRQAIEVFEKGRDNIDLVVLDMIMPEMNGYDCFVKIKQIKPEQKIILASGFLHQNLVEEMKTMGLNLFIGKPFNSIELSLAIHEVMSS